jgi:hypothetical protein
MRKPRTRFGPPVSTIRVGAVVSVVDGKPVATVKVLSPGDVPLARAVVDAESTGANALAAAAAAVTARLVRFLASRPGIRPEPLAIRVLV